jgi:hypothetical protein
MERFCLRQPNSLLGTGLIDIQFGLRHRIYRYEVHDNQLLLSLYLWLAGCDHDDQHQRMHRRAALLAARNHYDDSGLPNRIQRQPDRHHILVMPDDLWFARQLQHVGHKRLHSKTCMFGSCFVNVYQFMPIRVHRQSNHDNKLLLPRSVWLASIKLIDRYQRLHIDLQPAG